MVAIFFLTRLTHDLLTFNNFKVIESSDKNTDKSCCAWSIDPDI